MASFRRGGSVNDPTEANVLRAAESGASCATRELQVVRDAVDRTLQQWRARRDTIADPEAWAFRVAKNAARKLGRQFGCRADPRPCEILDALPARAVRASVSPDERECIRQSITVNKEKFRGRQVEVALKLTEPQMSLRRAAEELGMERCNLKRSFRGALKRLKSLET